MNHNAKKAWRPKRITENKRFKELGSPKPKELVPAPLNPPIQVAPVHEPPRSERHIIVRRKPSQTDPGDKFPKNRCCFVKPQLTDFGQIVCMSSRGDPINFSQSQQTSSMKHELKDEGSTWLQLDSVDDVDRVMLAEAANNQTLQSGFINTGLIPARERCPCGLKTLENVQISDTPRVKVVAEKFSRMKSGDVEVRRLEEKLVCLEYDVFERERPERPQQTLRAYFSIRPTMRNYNKGSNPQLGKPQKFVINAEDLEHLDEKEIEIIDENIAENQPYLEDLRYVLQRKQEHLRKKENETIDVNYLYDMAKNHPDVPEASYLTKEELRNVKNLLISKSKSSVHGLSRKKYKAGTKSPKKRLRQKKSGFISQSFYNELMAIS